MSLRYQRDPGTTSHTHNDATLVLGETYSCAIVLERIIYNLISIQNILRYYDYDKLASLYCCTGYRGNVYRIYVLVLEISLRRFLSSL